jgi:predicted Holliday junction resolvase-like endonuclease
VTFVPVLFLRGGFVPTDTFGIAVGIAIGFFLAWGYLQVWKVRYSHEIREDAVQRSQAITAGKVHEQLIPYLPAFPYNPKDVRFLGSPVDLVVFDGLAAGCVERIVFLEVKTGGAGLTQRERSVRDAIQDGAVEWAELRVRPAGSGVAAAW